MSLAQTKKIAGIISDAGGKIVGRTRLQKIAYLLVVTGMESGLEFKYKHYGPYSEDLASAARLGHLIGDLHEAEHSASWGGSYSIFTTEAFANIAADENRRRFATAAANADAIDLELAATAVFLAKEGFPDPWDETSRRKPEKTENGRIDRARELLRELAQIPTPNPLPVI
ncbi:hypothetical protein [Hoeflea sp. AS16]|uniref:hypothetical protein n=1 Tax=Hoeflea sp. AS16 TaxID=3135779 RepID=UPI00316E9A4C